MENVSENKSLIKSDITKRFVSVKLRRELVEGMISTYEFLCWDNTGEEKRDCKKILNALKKSLLC